MNTKVIVISDETGSVINLSEKNPNWGYIRVQQSVIAFDKGIMKRKVRTALINAELVDLYAMDFQANQEMNGKIVVEESLMPFNSKNPDRDIKIAGGTGIICNVDGQPIYRRTYFTNKANAMDLEIQHTNVEELRMAYKSDINVSALKPNEEFIL